jgi:hypothetical protein
MFQTNLIYDNFTVVPLSKAIINPCAFGINILMCKCENICKT